MKQAATIFGLLLFLAHPGCGQSTNISGLFQNNFKKAERIYLQQPGSQGPHSRLLLPNGAI
jgi:hypothetical protein